MSAFEAWLQKVLLTGSPFPVRFEMSPEEIQALFGEPYYRLALKQDPDTTLVLFYQSETGTVRFNFENDEATWLRGTELGFFEETSKPPRFRFQRVY